MIIGVVYFRKLRIGILMLKNISRHKEIEVIYKRQNIIKGLFRDKTKGNMFFYLQGSPYSYAEVSSQIRSCLHDSMVNTAPRIGQIMDKLEQYRQCSPRRVKCTNMTELEKCDCLSSVTTIAHILNIGREKKGAMRILQVINDGVYVCICRVFSDVFKNILHMHLSMTVTFHNWIRVNVVVQYLMINLMHIYVY